MGINEIGGQMRPQRKIPESDLEGITLNLKKAKSTIEYRHTQVLYLRGIHGKTTEEIATITNYCPQQVSSILTDYFEHGLQSLRNLNKPKTRKWGNMTFDEEQSFIATYLDKAKEGQMIVVSAIQTDYEQAIGKKTSSSVIYNILHRHGWRKIVPRSAHPKRDSIKANAFKKTLKN